MKEELDILVDFRCPNCSEWTVFTHIGAVFPATSLFVVCNLFAKWAVLIGPLLRETFLTLGLKTYNYQGLFGSISSLFTRILAQLHNCKIGKEIYTFKFVWPFFGTKTSLQKP